MNKMERCSCQSLPYTGTKERLETIGERDVEMERHCINQTGTVADFLVTRHTEIEGFHL